MYITLLTSETRNCTLSGNHVVVGVVTEVLQFQKGGMSVSMSPSVSNLHLPRGAPSPFVSDVLSAQCWLGAALRRLARAGTELGAA